MRLPCPSASVLLRREREESSFVLIFEFLGIPSHQIQRKQVIELRLYSEVLKTARLLTPAPGQPPCTAPKACP